LIRIRGETLPSVAANHNQQLNPQNPLWLFSLLSAANLQQKFLLKL